MFPERYNTTKGTGTKTVLDAFEPRAAAYVSKYRTPSRTRVRDARRNRVFRPAPKIVQRPPPVPRKLVVEPPKPVAPYKPPPKPRTVIGQYVDKFPLERLPRYRKGAIVLDVVFGILQNHYEEIIKKQVELQPRSPGKVDLQGTNWFKSGSCGPWSEDSILPGGNFCFVGNGVPESSLHQPLAPGFSAAYTVQINGGEVPGGIDCTASQFYESATPFSPDPVPVFRPPVVGPILPIGIDTLDTAWARNAPYPDPPPIRGPGAKPGIGGNVGFGPPNPRYGYPRYGDDSPHPIRVGGRRPPPHRWVRPPPGTKEKKARFSLGKFWTKIKRALEETSEMNDLLDSFYDALPWEVRRKYKYKPGGMHAQDKLRVIWENYGQVQLYGYKGLLWNVLDNNIKDWGIGKVGSSIKHATRNNPYWVSPVGPQAGGRFRGERVYVQPAT